MLMCASCFVTIKPVCAQRTWGFSVRTEAQYDLLHLTCMTSCQAFCPSFCIFWYSLCRKTSGLCRLSSRDLNHALISPELSEVSIVSYHGLIVPLIFISIWLLKNGPLVTCILRQHLLPPCHRPIALMLNIWRIDTGMSSLALWTGQEPVVRVSSHEVVRSTMSLVCSRSSQMWLCKSGWMKSSVYLMPDA